jgi:hypothetical protein
MVIATTCSTLWTLYGWAVGDAFVTSTSVYNVIFGFFVIIRTVQERTRIQVPAPQVAY